AGQQVEHISELVVIADKFKTRLNVFGVVIRVERNGGPARSIVVVPIDVELVDHIGVLRTYRVGGQPRGRAGAEESVERVDQRRRSLLVRRPDFCPVFYWAFNRTVR